MKRFFANIRYLLLFLLLCFGLVRFPARADASEDVFQYLPEAGSCPKYAQKVYDRNSAIEKAIQENWSPLGFCSDYVSLCLRSGGLEIKVPGCTSLDRALRAIPGITVYHKTIDSASSILMEELADNLNPGDVAIYRCANCAKRGIYSYVHTLLYMGTDEKGRMIGYSHNPWESTRKAYWYQKDCYDCHAILHDIYFYHFPELHEGWAIQNGKLMYLNSECQPVTGETIIGGEVYAFRSDGSPVAGWQREHGIARFFSPAGKLLKEEENDIRFHFEVF